MEGRLRRSDDVAIGMTDVRDRRPAFPQEVCSGAPGWTGSIKVTVHPSLRSHSAVQRPVMPAPTMSAVAKGHLLQRSVPAPIPTGRRLEGKVHFHSTRQTMRPRRGQDQMPSGMPVFS